MHGESFPVALIYQKQGGLGTRLNSMPVQIMAYSFHSPEVVWDVPSLGKLAVVIVDELVG